MPEQPADVSLPHLVLNHWRLQQRAGDEAVALRLLDEVLGFAAGQTRGHLHTKMAEAQPAVVGVHTHSQLPQLHVALARHVCDRQCEARGERGEKDFRRRGSLVVAAGGRRFVGEDLEVADGDVRAVAPLPVGEEGLVSHGQRYPQRRRR